MLCEIKYLNFLLKRENKERKILNFMSSSDVIKCNNLKICDLILLELYLYSAQRLK